ncbi:hypothetical protein C8R46DRAFT_1085231 [Mycena filopes]|nr:hypothetical protein C8R46DRAFT_1085231 [Mycena filopes]
MSSSTSQPATLPLKPLPPLWGGPRNGRNAPLYGLAWRSSLADIFRKFETKSLSSVPNKVFVQPFLEQLEPFVGCVKIKYSLQFRYDDSAEDGRDHVCFITFNDKEKNLATLAGPDGDKFMEIMKNMMKINEADEATLMWYRCVGMANSNIF